MFIRVIIIVLSSCLMFGCASSFNPVELASQEYKSKKDYASLEVIYSKLSRGMPEAEVKSLLGRPDGSPENGKYYYVSTESFYSEEKKRDVSIGLILDYRINGKEVSDVLQNYWVGQLDDKSNIISGL